MYVPEAGSKPIYTPSYVDPVPPVAPPVLHVEQYCQTKVKHISEVIIFDHLL